MSKNTENDNGKQPAFPIMYEDESYEGLTKREYFAAMAMQGILANDELRIALLKDKIVDGTTVDNFISVYAIKQADALLNQPNPTPNEK